MRITRLTRLTRLARPAAVVLLALVPALAVPAAAEGAPSVAPGVPSLTASPADAAAIQRPRWRISQAGRLPEGYLSSVTAPGPEAAWAAGHQRDESGVAHGVVLRWNGDRWRRVPASALPDIGYWHSVSASSPRDVWVYGWGQREAAVARFDGASWRRVPMPVLPEGASTAYAELAVARGAAWLAGETWVARSSGGTWETTSLPEGVHITSIDARTPSDVWMAGYVFEPGSGVQPYTTRWDGAAWSPVDMPENDLVVTDVYAGGRDDVWVTGWIPEGEEQRPAVLRWDGEVWRDAGLPDEGQTPTAISGDGRGRLWVTGDPAGFQGPPLFWRYDGTGWLTVAGELPPGGRAEIMNGLAPVRGTNRHWAVGGYSVDDGEVSRGFELIARDG
ncbi:hypothetical protein [Sphaerisporangium sp. TRM90804]|uniref:hypothetical protein n=1 Tax=Sphaerisporangium sp. TRM90804 TaxID=3031113 RepID=UPI00244CC438|nr:hypothetical protein [Sphaerisporangium sp. TRM90804]MDH2425436.1 hypothetical protein [Sphaerisporangium sp. TRM90804]